MQPVQINNESDEMVEISAAEYKAVMEFSVAISEQNAATEVQNIATQEAVARLADVVTEMSTALLAAIQNLQVTVNVPKQPAPVVNVSPAAVTLNTPQKEKNVAINVKRDKDGRIASATGTIK